MRQITLSEPVLDFVAARGRVITISEQIYLVG